MALRVWLPLNGNLENKGVGNVTISGTGTFVNDGKLGKGYTGGPISMSQNFLTTVGTICFWIKVKTDAAASVSPNQIFSSSGTYGRKWDLFLFSTSTATYPHKNSFHSWGCVKDTSTGSANGSFTYNGLFPNDVWVHVAVAHDTAKQYIYVNGSPYATVAWDSNGTFTFDGICYFANTNSSSIIYNDLRIYDECLSQKQIKEISKGLIAHYKLEGTGANPNLLLHADKYLKNSPKIKTGTGTDLYDTPGVYYNGLDTSKYYIYSMCCDGTLATAHGGTSTTDATKKYWTAWLYYQDTPYSDSSYSSFKTPVCYHANCSSDSNMYLGNIGNRYYWRVKPPYVNCSVRINAYSNGTDSVSVKFWDFKLEEGSKLTAWLPNQADTLYSILGYNNIIARDVSGNSYNGTVSGTLSYNADSPRYAGSTNFSAPGYIHYLPSPINSSAETFTFSCWFYPTQNATMALYNDRTAVGDGLSVFYLGSGIRFDTGASAQYQAGSITLNAWNFITCVFDKNNNTKKIYINGNQVGSTSTIGSLSAIGSNASIGNSSTNGAAGAGNQIYGSLSDVRIYATALTADDILTLYKTSGIIDNKGNVYAYEFKEE